MEGLIRFKCGPLQLEGLFLKNNAEQGIVVTHPHPLYGGEMRNNVVETVVDTARRAGYATLRFNFRGVGGSEGSYDAGHGEQKDVRAAIGFMREQGIGRVVLAGYSFGSWVNALAGFTAREIDRMIMVSPPVNFLDFGPVESLPMLTFVIGGDEDEFAPADRVKAMAAKWNPDAELIILPNTDHFYIGSTRLLEEELRGQL